MAPTGPRGPKSKGGRDILDDSNPLVDKPHNARPEPQDLKTSHDSRDFISVDALQTDRPGNRVRVKFFDFSSASNASEPSLLGLRKLGDLRTGP